MKSDTIVAHGARMVSPPRTAQEDISLRDWFAGQALVGISLNDRSYHWSSEDMAARAYEAADAMLAERGKGND